MIRTEVLVFSSALLATILVVPGCSSPEYGRLRGGGHGADGGNYQTGGVHVPSKIDGTRTWTARPKS
jgi:hypothetical protein